MRRTLSFGTLAVSLLCALALGCSSPPPPVDGFTPGGDAVADAPGDPYAHLVAIEITPSPIFRPAGRTQQLTVTGVDAAGARTDVTRAVTWESAFPRVGTVDSSGLLTLHSMGRTLIVAVLGRLRSPELVATAGEAVTEAVTVTPAEATLHAASACETLPLRATATLSDRTERDVTELAEWASGAPEFVLVATEPGQRGVSRATGTASGVSLVRATYQGVTSEPARVTVAPEGCWVGALALDREAISVGIDRFDQLFATARLVDGRSEDFTSRVRWESSDPTVASVSATGRVTAHAVGHATITASYRAPAPACCPTAQASVGVEVVPVPVAIEVSPRASQLPAGTSLRLRATARFTDGTFRPMRSGVAWSSSAPGIATVDAQGRVRAVAPGTATIYAETGGPAAEAQVTVTDALARGLVIEAPEGPLVPGVAAPMQAYATFSDGTTHEVTDVAVWSSSSADIATATTAGVVTGRVPGSAVITASLGAFTAQVPVTVSADPIAWIELRAPRSWLTRSVDATLRVIGHIGSSTEVDLTSDPSLALAVTPATLAELSSAPGERGRLRGLTEGNVTVRAEFAPPGRAAASSSLTLQVIDLVPDSLEVLLGAATIPLGFGSSLRVLGHFGPRGVADLTNERTLAWFSADPSIVTLEPSTTTGGATELRTHAVGTTEAAAWLYSLPFLRGRAPVVVSGARLVSLWVTSSRSEVRIGGMPAYLAAVGTFEDGSISDVTHEVAWTVSDPERLWLRAGRAAPLPTARQGTVSITASRDDVTGGTAINVLTP